MSARTRPRFLTVLVTVGLIAGFVLSAPAPARVLADSTPRIQVAGPGAWTVWVQPVDGPVTIEFDAPSGDTLSSLLLAPQFDAVGTGSVAVELSEISGLQELWGTGAGWTVHVDAADGTELASVLLPLLTLDTLNTDTGEITGQADTDLFIEVRTSGRDGEASWQFEAPPSWSWFTLDAEDNPVVAERNASAIWNSLDGSGHQLGISYVWPSFTYQSRLGDENYSDVHHLQSFGGAPLGHRGLWPVPGPVTITVNDPLNEYNDTWMVPVYEAFGTAGFEVDLEAEWGIPPEAVTAGWTFTARATIDSVPMEKRLVIEDASVDQVDFDVDTGLGNASGRCTPDAHEWIVQIGGNPSDPDGGWSEDFYPPCTDGTWSIEFTAPDQLLSVKASYQDGDSDVNTAAWDVYVPEPPWFSVDTPHQVWGNGEEWPDGAIVELIVDDDLDFNTADSGSYLYYDSTTVTYWGPNPWDQGFNFNLGDVPEGDTPFGIQPGQLVTILSDYDLNNPGPEIRKDLWVADLDNVTVNEGALTISGANAPDGAFVNVNIGQAWRNAPVTGGAWAADFGVAPEPDGGDGVLTVFGGNAGGSAQIWDGDGDSTHASLNPPSIHVSPYNDSMFGSDWAPGTVTVTINDDPVVPAPVVDEWGGFNLDLAIKPLDDVVVTQNGWIAHVDVQDLQITAVNEPGTVSVQAPVGAFVDVTVWTNDGGYANRIVQALEGTFTVDLSIPGENGEGTVTLGSESLVRAHIYNDLDLPDYDATIHDYNIPTIPWFSVETPHQVWGNGEEWPDGATVELIVDDNDVFDTADPDSYLYHDSTTVTYWGPNPWDQGFNFNLGDVPEGETPFDIQPGQLVTILSDGPEIHKDLWVADLDNITVNEGALTISGITDAPENSTVTVSIGQAWRDALVTTGAWAADFGVAPGPDGGDGILTVFGGNAGGSAQIWDDDGDITQVNIRSPYIHISPYNGYVFGDGWDPATPVDVWHNGVLIDPLPTANEDSHLDFGLDTTPGDTVRAEQGGWVAETTVLDLEITSVDPSTGMVSGRAPEGALVDVHAWPRDGGFASRAAYAVDGSFEVNFFTEGDPELDWGTETIPMDQGTSFRAHIYHDRAANDHDATRHGWEAPPIRQLEVYPDLDMVGAWWLDGDTTGFTVTVDRDDIEVFTGFQPGPDGWINFWAEDPPFDVQRGDLVTLTDGETTKDHIVVDLTIDPISQGQFTATGTGPPGAEIWVGLGGRDLDGGIESQWTTVQGDETWTATFGTAFELGHAVEATAFEPEIDGNDQTHVLSYLPSPFITAVINQGYVQGEDFPEGEMVTVTVDDPTTPESPDYTISPAPTVVRQSPWPGNSFWATDGGLDLQPGYIVTATVPDHDLDGEPDIRRVHEIIDLTLEAADVDSGFFDGHGPPDTSVLFDASNDSGEHVYRWLTTTLDTDPGYWSTDVSDEMGVPLATGTAYSIEAFDNDGDVTNVGDCHECHGNSGPFTFFDEGDLLISQTSGTIWAWDTESDTLIGDYQLPFGGTWDIQYRDSGHLLIANSGNGRIMELDLATGDVYPVYEGGPDFFPIGIALDPSGDVLYIAESDEVGGVFRFDLPDGPLVQLHDQPADGIAYRDGYVYFGGLERIRPDGTDYEQVVDLGSDGYTPNGFVFTPEGNIVMTSMSPAAVLEIDPETGDVTPLYQGEGMRSPEDVALAPDFETSRDIYVIDSGYVDLDDQDDQPGEFGVDSGLYRLNRNTPGLEELQPDNPFGDVVDLLIALQPPTTPSGVPRLQAFLTEDRISGEWFTPNAEVLVTLYDFDGQPLSEPDEPYGTNGEGHFEGDAHLEQGLQPGMVLEVRDVQLGVTLRLELADIRFDSFDPDTNMVAGYVLDPPSDDIFVQLANQDYGPIVDEFGNPIRAHVDGTGWDLDLGEAGYYPSGLTDARVEVYDADGNGETLARLPQVQVIVPHTVQSSDFDNDSTVDVQLIDITPEGPVTVVIPDVEVNGRGEFGVPTEEYGVDLDPGDVVIVTGNDTGVMKRHEVFELTIGEVDYENDTISGTAAPNVWVNVGGEFGDETVWSGDGNWTVTVEEGIEEGMMFGVRIGDPDLDFTVVEPLPPPRIIADPFREIIRVEGFPIGHELELTVRDDTGMVIGPLYGTVDGPAIGWFLIADGLFIEPGQLVTVRDLAEVDPEPTRELVIADIGVSLVDDDTETIFGTVDPGAGIHVQVGTEFGFGEQFIETDPFGTGEWTAGFGSPEFEGVDIDKTMQWYLRLAVPDEDGDETVFEPPNASPGMFVEPNQDVVSTEGSGLGDITIRVFDSEGESVHESSVTPDHPGSPAGAFQGFEFDVFVLADQEVYTYGRFLDLSGQVDLVPGMVAQASDVLWEMEMTVTEFSVDSVDSETNTVSGFNPLPVEPLGPGLVGTFVSGPTAFGFDLPDSDNWSLAVTEIVDGEPGGVYDITGRETGLSFGSPTEDQPYDTYTARLWGPPEITTFELPFEPVDFDNPVVWLDAEFTDIELPDDSHTVTIDWGDGDMLTIDDAATLVLQEHTYTATGVYNVEMTVTDDHGLFHTKVHLIVVTEVGFITGGGWIDSPAGAYTADPDLTGQANFGFVAKYKKGKSAPDGNTNFQFQAAGLHFQSTSYDWLVVTGGDKAKFKGNGTINGDGNYGFMVTAVDDPDGDTFRIKIWDGESGLVVYDNRSDIADDGYDATLLGGGSIVVHDDK